MALCPLTTLPASTFVTACPASGATIPTAAQVVGMNKGIMPAVSPWAAYLHRHNRHNPHNHMPPTHPVEVGAVDATSVVILTTPHPCGWVGGPTVTD